MIDQEKKNDTIKIKYINLTYNLPLNNGSNNSGIKNHENTPILSGNGKSLAKTNKEESNIKYLM